MAKKVVKEEQPEETTAAPEADAAAEPIADPPSAAPVLDPNDTSALPQFLREATVREVRDLFAKADALLAVLEKRADERFLRARNKLGETIGALV